MSKEIDKIIEALENISIKFDELGFSPTIPIFKGNKAHFVDWFKIEIDTIKVVTNKQAQRIAELEEQLKNVIMLNLKVGQEVYVIENEDIFKDILEKIEITEDGILFYVEEGIYGFEENEIFATFEEALAKLEELKGEKV